MPEWLNERFTDYRRICRERQRLSVWSLEPESASVFESLVHWLCDL